MGKRRIYVWPQYLPSVKRGWPPVWFTAAYMPHRLFSVGVGDMRHVCVHPHKPEVSHYYAEGKAYDELMNAALEYRRCFRECLNT